MLETPVLQRLEHKKRKTRQSRKPLIIKPSALVRITGVEPAPSCPDYNLNLARLPIPPYSHFYFLNFTRRKLPRVKLNALITDKFGGHPKEPAMVRETGLEPVRDYHTPLKRARLPIPPLSQVCSESLSLFPQNVDYYSKRGCLCQAFFQSFFNIFSFIFERRLAWDYPLSKAVILSAIALNTGAQSDAPPLPLSLKTVMT